MGEPDLVIRISGKTKNKDIDLLLKGDQALSFYYAIKEVLERNGTLKRR